VFRGVTRLKSLHSSIIFAFLTSSSNVHDTGCWAKATVIFREFLGFLCNLCDFLKTSIVETNFFCCSFLWKLCMYPCNPAPNTATHRQDERPARELLSSPARLRSVCAKVINSTSNGFEHSGETCCGAMSLFRLHISPDRAAEVQLRR
jgi:hypothetical protein